MDKTLIASGSIKIKSTAGQIWNILTNPENIKIYLFGTETITDWKIGNPIVFQGDYEGHKYKDKGNVIENKPHELLKYNYWSGFSGLEDQSDNYALVTYSLEKIEKDHFKFTWHQQGFSSEDGKCHAQEGLITMLELIKKLDEV